jgi:hypothetical protein
VTEAIERFAGDLREAGIDGPDVARLTDLYDLALRSAGPAQWRGFYRATFQALRRSTRENPIRTYRAVDALLCLLEDDLGADLFGGEAIARLRHAVT